MHVTDEAVFFGSDVHRKIVVYRAPDCDRDRFEDFDFEFQPSIDKAVITDLALLRFVYNADNVVFLGPPSVGKIKPLKLGNSTPLLTM
jgi:DNA replication protein DnaC